MDVNGDGQLTPRDALNLLNAIRGDSESTVENAGTDQYFLDVNGDSILSASDLITVINRLAVRQNNPVSFEALQMAIYATDSYTPPYETASIIDRDLTAIRSKYPFLKYTQFTAADASGKLLVKIDTETETSPPFNELLDSVEGNVVHRSETGWITIDLNPYLNIHHVAESFERVAGVSAAETVRSFGGSSNVSVRDNTYSFFRGDGDCPAGCIVNAYWTVVVDDREPVITRRVGETDYFENEDSAPLLDIAKTASDE